MPLKPTEVFVPGAYPTYTYIERKDRRLEQSLENALATPGQLVSLSGPSKSGKTVLVEKVVGRDNLISISGAGIQHPDDVWELILDWMDVPQSTSHGRTLTGSAEVKGGAAGSIGVPLVAQGQVKAEGSVGFQRAAEREEVRARRGLEQVIEEIGDSAFVILIDDFHYMPREVQVEAAKRLKEAVRAGLKMCTASVGHRGDDVVRANPELRGRVKAIDLTYWAPEELKKIAVTGFEALGARLPGEALDAFVREAAGSPQLMQLICLNACFVLGIREPKVIVEPIDVGGAGLRSIFEQASSSTDFRSLVDVLEAGPKKRGSERKTYTFQDESRGDVYRCVLKAIATDPPRLSFPYDNLTTRTAQVCQGESPVGSSVVGTCTHMSRLAIERFPAERVIDWDEQKQVLDIPDPNLLFYLRWSGRLVEQ